MKAVLVRSIALLACISFMLLFNFSNEGLLWSAVQNAGHFVIFIAFTLACLTLFDSASLRQPLKHAVVISILFALGAAVELIQSMMPGRTASWSDLLLDAAGIFVGYLIFILVFHFKAISMVRRIAVVFGILITSYFSAQPALQLIGYNVLKTGHPALISFGDPFVESIISVTGSASTELIMPTRLINRGSRRLLRMDFADVSHGGVVFHDTAIEGTVSGFLNVKLHNASSQNRELAVRIHDRGHNNDYHDRYNRTLLVKPGANHYRLSLAEIKSMGSKGDSKRQLDTENIDEIQLFSLERNSFSVYLSDLLLTP